MNNYRSEIKFVSYKQNYSLIKNWIRFHKFNFFKEYDDRNINNIYFDSLDYKAFNDNLVGLPSRLKVRYRWYGNLFSNDKKNEGSLEFKFKKNIYFFKKIFKINDLTLNLNSNWKDIKNKILKKLTPEYKILFDKNSEKVLINRYKRDVAALSSNTRGVFGGGYNSDGYYNVMEYITIASTGNSTDFGDLLDNYYRMAGTSSSTRGLFGGGIVGGIDKNVIQYITIASTGNSQDFGDLLDDRPYLAACSNAHGGLA